MAYPVTHLYDVAVIGCGPAGSYAATLLATAGHDVIGLDRQRLDELAPCCTGVVGPPYVELLGLESDLILAGAKAASFHSPSGRQMRVASSEVQAYVLDRAALERRLRLGMVAAGAEVREGVMVSGVSRGRDHFVVAGMHDGHREWFAARSIVLAAGVSPGLARQLGLGVPGRYLVGVHVEVAMDGVPETEVHVMPDAAPGAFAWLVPVGAQRVRVGALAMRSPASVVERLLERPDVRRRLRNRLTPVVQRPVPVAASRQTHAHGVLAIGDAAGQVKPTTGGGLYFGALAARVAAEVLGQALASDELSANTLAAYRRRWRSVLGRELRCGALARYVYNRLSARRVDGLMGWADRRGVATKILASGSFSFDWHSTGLLSGFVRCLPGVLLGWDPELPAEEA